MTIGAELRQAREQGGLTLVEISQRTKIRVPVLRAIERDDFGQLPGGVISRGFLKLFAREVGLDADEIVTRFTAEVESDETERHSRLDRHGREVATDQGASVRHRRRPRANAPGARAPPRSQLAVLAILAIGYFASRPASAARSGPNPERSTADGVGAAAVEASSAPNAADPASPPAAASEPVPAAPPESTSGNTGTSADGLRVDLEAIAACWISATVDGNQVAYRALSPGERLALRATNEVILRIGIPANLTVSINDQRVPPFARPGTPVTLRITPANYRELLKR